MSKGGKRMLMNVLKVSDSNNPNTVNKETDFLIGQSINMEYDWSIKESCMNGYKGTPSKDTANFVIKDIFCNMLINPCEVMLTLTTDDKTFIERCKCSEFNAFEYQVKGRILDGLI